MSETKTYDDLIDKASAWWNRLKGYDKGYYVKHYEGGVVPIAALTEGAIMRLYLKVFENLTQAKAMKKYHNLLAKKP